MLTAVLAIVSFLIAAYFVTVAGTLWHPAAVLFAIWGAVFGLLALNMLDLAPVTGRGAAVVFVGNAAVAVGAAVAMKLELVSRPASEPMRWLPGALDGKRLLFAGLVVGLVVLMGTRAVRTAIESAAGRPFESLTAQEVRWATVYGDARSAGLASISFLLAPLLAGIGVAFAARNRLGWLLTLAAVMATTLTPARTFTVTTVLITLLFWLYLRPMRRPRRAPAGRSSRTGLAVIAGIAVVVASVSYFNTQGDRLEKNQFLVSQLPNSRVPDQLVPITAYFVASVPALSVAIDDETQPAADRRFRSIWLIPRALSIIDPHVDVPDTVAGFTNVPFPHNTYTWAGDVWFDFGWLGVLLCGLTLGAGLILADGLARARPSVVHAWTASVVLTLGFWSVIELRFFWLEFPIWLVSGALVFRLCESGRPEPVRSGSDVVRPLSVPQEYGRLS